MSDKRQSSFRRFRSRRPRENVEECRCSDHCRCCDTQTTEEVYTVTLENAHPGSKVGVGDNFKIYKTESVNINPKEKMVVQLEQVRIEEQKLEKKIVENRLQISEKSAKHTATIFLQIFLRQIKTC
jgi:hypothetical protein